jgi:hypothetical protein
MATEFGFFKVYEFKNAIHDFLLAPMFSFGFFFLVAPLQPLRGTLGELK